MNKLITGGFIAAGIANIAGIFAVTHGMTSDTLALADPAVFSSFGVLMIMVWGLAYLSTASVANTAILLPATFAIEKLAYTINWAVWMSNNSDQVPSLIEQDFIGGLFMGGYGINDGLFCLFFAAVAIINLRRKQNS